MDTRTTPYLLPGSRFFSRVYYGWWIVAVCTIISVAADAIYNPVLSVFVKPVSAELGWSRATFSGAISLGACLGGLVSILLGPTLDRRGARDVMVGGAALLGTCLIGLYFLDSVWQFYLLVGMARASAIAASQMAATVAISNWFFKHRGRAIGVMFSGGRLGAAIVPPIAQYLIPAIGWRLTFLSMGLFVWVSSILPSWLVIRRRPEDMGLRPDGEAVPSVATAGTQARPGPLEPAWTLPEAMRTFTFWMLIVVGAGGMMATGGVNLHQVPYMTDQGIDPTTAVMVLAVFSLCAGIGGFSWGLACERFKVRHVLIVSLLLSAAALVTLLFADNVPLALAYAVFYGLSMGGINAMTPLAFADYYGRRSLGAISGVFTPFQVVGNALGPLLAGWLYDLNGNYVLAFLLLAGVYIAGAALMLFARPPQRPVRRS